MERPNFLNPQTEFELLGAGRRSTAFEVDGHIIKEVRMNSTRRLESLLSRLQQQYRELKTFMDPYVVETGFIIGQGQTGPTIFISQPKIQGISLEQAILEGREGGNDLRQIRQFLLKARSMRAETGYIPDLFGKISGLQYHRWYNPRYTRNVIVTRDEDIYTPHLVDTNYSHRSERREGTIMHNRLLSFGITNLLKQF